MILEGDESIPDLDEISQGLVRGLPDDLADPRASDRKWTQAIKQRLFDMGKAQGLMVCCHGSEDQGEWLLDVIWMVRERREIVLAVESEWGRLPQIEDDFDKLMSIKARRKLLLFSTTNHKGADDIVSKLEQNLVAYPYHIAGEEYMALEVTAPGIFRYRFGVPSDGRLETVRFAQLGEPLAAPWL